MQTYEKLTATDDACRINTYYDLADLSIGGESLCIPVPLLARDWAIHFAAVAKWTDRGWHNRSVNVFDADLTDDIIREMRSLVSAAEGDAAKAVLENGDHNETLALIAGDYRNGHKPVLRVDDDE